MMPFEKCENKKQKKTKKKEKLAKKVN